MQVITKETKTSAASSSNPWEKETLRYGLKTNAIMMIILAIRLRLKAGSN